MDTSSKLRCSLAPFDATVDSQDLRREWEEWLRAFELEMEMQNVFTQHEKFVRLLSFGGRGLQRIFYNLKPVPEEIIPEVVPVPMRPPEDPEYDNAIKRLDKFFVGKVNDRVELEIFRSLRQKPDESFFYFFSWFLKIVYLPIVRVTNYHNLLLTNVQTISKNNPYVFSLIPSMLSYFLFQNK